MKPNSQGILKPLEVPWQLGNRNTRFEIAYAENDYLIVEVTARRLTAPSLLAFQDCRIQITFDDPNQFSFGRGFGEDDFIELFDYDRDFEDFGGDDDINQGLYERWFLTGKCPNPYAYEVIESAHLRSIGLDPIGYREFLLVGDDPSLIVASKTFSWKLISS